jgi:predicted transcriptional regulator of viral defense system
VDAYLVASKLATDAVLAFHTALDVLGFGHSVFNTYHYFSKTYRRPVRFRGGEYRSVKAPPKLLKASKELFGTTKVERLGIKILTTDKERTLVEALEHPEYCGGFEETWRSLEKIPYIQPETVLEYLGLRAQKNLFARVGFFLEQHCENFHVEESFLQQLEQSKPAQPVYWGPRSKGGVLVKRWNLIVPEAVKNRRWEEF